jgi:hypothetical protein
MTTKLEGPLKREFEIAGTLYTLTITPEGMTLVLKGKRNGFALEWAALVSGEAALATALNASLTANLAGTTASDREGGKGAKARDGKDRER